MQRSRSVHPNAVGLIEFQRERPRNDQWRPDRFSAMRRHTFFANSGDGRQDAGLQIYRADAAIVEDSHVELFAAGTESDAIDFDNLRGRRRTIVTAEALLA